MGMIFVARPLTAEELASVRSDPSVADDLLVVEDEAVVDVDKAWHGIHFLLTGTAGEATDALGWVILGGEPLEDTDGPVRLLDPDQVRAVAAALSGTSDTTLRQRFDPVAMHRAELYPQIWDEGPTLLDLYLLPGVATLRTMYAEAAAMGAAVIARIS